MPFSLIRDDITALSVDAIVNAANTGLTRGGGVCGAIFEAAGSEALASACEGLAPIGTGEAVVTPGFGLRAGRIVHTAGPVYRDGRSGEEELLRKCYLNSLLAAEREGCVSVAFPLISSGVYGYPKKEALRVAVSAIREWLGDHDTIVFLCLFDNSALSGPADLAGGLEGFLGFHLGDGGRGRPASACPLDASPLDIGMGHTKTLAFSKRTGTAEVVRLRFGFRSDPEVLTPKGMNLRDMVGGLERTFSDALLGLIKEKGMTDTEVYKRANIDRRLFSKIRTGRGYMPSKRTALALAVALRLSLEETDDLLERAGYALSHSLKFDVIVEYFIISGRYDIYEINEVLFEHDEPLLGL